LAFHGHHESLDLTLPPTDYGLGWLPVLDTAVGFTADPEPDQLLAPSSVLSLTARSVVVLRCPRPDSA
ncbi:MAG: hypothetical protein ACRC0L_11390, partial [Angustibacter sp.]